jgi:dienelactone hydrolase
MMAYDPFMAGPLHVAEAADELVDADRGGRRLPVQVWYPSDDGGPYPLILFSHTSAGHRRQSSFLCSHLASHGYVVAAVDHVGNTAADVVARRASGKPLGPEELGAYIKRIIADRVPDLRCLLGHMLAGSLAARIDQQKLGIVGWSFGGWAALGFPEVDDRCGAIVALAPGGNSRPLPGIIPATLTFAWRREIPTLYLVAEDDQYTPLPGQYELFDRTPSHRRMFILRHADHGHFGDEIEDEAGCSAEQAHRFTRGLSLAHLDAVLKELDVAEEFLENDAERALTARGVAVLRYPPAASAMVVDPSAIAVIGRTPTVLRALLLDLPSELIDAPNDEGWSLKDIVAHLVDAEDLAFVERISRMLNEEMPAIASIDPPARLDAGGYAARTLRDLLDDLQHQREQHSSWLRGLSPDQLTRAGNHDEVGEIRVVDIAHQWAAHDMAHLRQIALLIQQHVAPLMGATRAFYDV